MIKRLVSIGLVGLILTLALVFTIVSPSQAKPKHQPSKPKVASASVEVKKADCFTGEKLVYGEIKNATFSGTRNDTTGPGYYHVTATAKYGYHFANNKTKLEFKGELAGKKYCKELATAAVTITPATCESPEKLVWGEITNAKFSSKSTEDGTTGPGNYSVIAKANKGARFEGNKKTIKFEGELAAALTGEECVLGEKDTKTPVKVEPEVLPNTSSDNPVAAIATIIATTGVITGLGFGARNILGRKL